MFNGLNLLTTNSSSSNHISIVINTKLLVASEDRAGGVVWAWVVGIHITREIWERVVVDGVVEAREVAKGVEVKEVGITSTE
jgi:hypothetical protein